MGHAILYLVFVAIVGTWLKYELQRKHVSLIKHWRWVAAAVVLGLIASGLSIYYGGKLGNFLLHGIGGGMAAVCLYMYLRQTFQFQQHWRIELVILFAFVSTLGVLNELLEYGLESAHFEIFSLDTQDTWRDFVANTSGAFIAWAVIQSAFSTRKPSQKKKNKL